MQFILFNVVQSVYLRILFMCWFVITLLIWCVLPEMECNLNTSWPLMIRIQILPQKSNYMAAAAILNWFPIATLNILSCCNYRSQPSYKISCQYLNPRLICSKFLKFKMAAVRHLGIVASSYRTTHEVFMLWATHTTLFTNWMADT